ncbi:serine/threonine protein kinase [Nocardioides albertanoniae]|uniref:non-specific serine/threonine protein kinase n=1 Tax=Nocardioides albertanoniae TaxID=1175486 RepID=A0A543ADR3_9ACTN|nr:protein kinase [Nocardioides albertanoniae]TQL70724.1 serine/threonine protein kinase [Nocardioides albertanoniae]
MTTLHPGAVFGHYRMDRILGEGGMGVVYDAFDTQLERQVALKMVHAHLADRQFIDMFIREGQTLAQIRSPHIIAIYDIGEQQGSPFIVTQYIKGGDVTGLVRSKGPLAPHLACLVNAQVAEALHDAHQAGIIHQDVKPSNVLVRNPNSPIDPFGFLCDFGIATSSSDSPAGGITGTWNYLAPEYIRDERDEQGRPIAPAPSRDIYAAGCMLWFTLTGKVPYSGEAVQVAMAHQNAPIPQFVGDDAWTRGANRILQLSMAKDRRQRYQSAAAFKDDLLKLREITAPAQLVPAPSMADRNPAPIPVSAVRAPTESEAILIEEAERPSRITPFRVGAAMVGVAALGIGGALAITQPWKADGPEPIVPTVKGAAYADVNGDKFGDVVTNVANPDGEGVDVVTWSSDGRTLKPSKPVTVDDPALPADNDGDQVFPLCADFTGDGKNSLVTFVRSKKGFNFDGGLEGSIKAPAGVVADGKKMAGSTFYYDLGVDDFDGDGVADLFMSTRFGNPDATLDKQGRTVGEGKIWVYRGTKSGFAEPTLFASYPATPVEQIAVGDFTGDEKADLVVLRRAAGNPEDITLTTGTSGLDLYEGDGSGVAAAKAFSFKHKGINSFLAGDVNGDGRDEVVVEESGRGEGQSITVGGFSDDLADFSIATRGRLPKPRDTLESTSRYPATLSDVNGDGLTDVVAASKEDNDSPYTFYVALGSKDGSFPGHTMATWKSSPDDVHLYNLMGGTLG